MKRPRPYIPIPVRLVVAIRQLRAANFQPSYVAYLASMINPIGRDSWRLKVALDLLFPGSRVHLDHDPALALRKFNRRTGKYTPDANDPNHLVYRSVHEHHIKTNVRGEGAQYPDRVLVKRKRRHERKRQKKPRQRWPTRKLRSRSSWHEQN